MKKDKSLKGWLDQLQQESWQLELLVSGFALVGLFNAQIFIDLEFTKLWNSSSSSYQQFVLVGVGFLLVAINIFIINLTAHLIVRGLWIGALGLRYVSGNIEFRKLNQSEIFERYDRKRITSFDHYIEWLEKISSIIFSYTFLLFFMLFSFVLYFLTIAILMVLSVKFGFGDNSAGTLVLNFNFGNFTNSFFYIVLSLHCLVGIVAAIDTILGKPLERIKVKAISTPYYFIHRYVSTITFSKLWRPLLLNFIDERFTKILYFCSIPYMILVVKLSVGSVLISNQYIPAPHLIFSNSRATSANEFYQYYYQNLQKELNKQNNKIYRGSFHIPNYRIAETQFLEVFINLDEYFDSLPLDVIDQLKPIYKFGFFDPLFSELLYPLDSDSNTQEFRSIVSNEKDSFQTYKFASSRNIESYQNFAKLNKGIIVENLDIYINELSVVDSNLICEFYQEPTFRKNGLLCFVATDSFKFGRNYISCGSKHNKESIVTIPFIYEGNKK